MITDEERRNVAADIRSAAERAKDDLNDDSNYSKIAVAYVVSCGIRGVPHYKDLLHLADLVNRPTCRNVSGHRDEFKCSECRCKVESLTEVCNERGEIFHVPFMPKYCPSCGAEVVEGD